MQPMLGKENSRAGEPMLGRNDLYSNSQYKPSMMAHQQQPLKPGPSMHLQQHSMQNGQPLRSLDAHSMQNRMPSFPEMNSKTQQIPMHPSQEHSQSINWNEAPEIRQRPSQEVHPQYSQPQLAPQVIEEIKRLGGIMPNTKEMRFRPNMSMAITQFINIKWNHTFFRSSQYNILVELCGYYKLYADEYPQYPILMRYRNDHFLIADGDVCIMTLKGSDSGDFDVYLITDSPNSNFPFNTPIKLSQFLSTLRPCQEPAEESDEMMSAPTTPRDQIVNDGPVAPFEEQEEQLISSFVLLDKAYNRSTLEPGEYMSDIIYDLHRQERRDLPDPDFVVSHPHLTERNRGQLMVWVFYMHKKLKLSPPTLYITVQMIDRMFAEDRNITPEYFNLLCAGCLFVASKYEEIYHPDINTLLHMCQNEYTREAFIHMERHILKVLDFRLKTTYLFPFIQRRYSKQSDARVRQLAYYLAESSILESFCSTVPVSMLLDAVDFTTHSILNNELAGPPPPPLVMECVRRLLFIVQSHYDLLNRFYVRNGDPNHMILNGELQRRATFIAQQIN